MDRERERKWIDTENVQLISQPLRHLLGDTSNKWFSQDICRRERVQRGPYSCISRGRFCANSTIELGLFSLLSLFAFVMHLRKFASPRMLVSCYVN